MTKVTLLSGIPRAAALNEAADRGKLVTDDAPNFAFLGDDRAKGALLLRQLRIFTKYYPERPEIRRSYELVRSFMDGKPQQTVGSSDIEKQTAAQLSRIRPPRPTIGSVESARKVYMQAILDGGPLPNIRDLCRDHNRGLVNTSRGKCRDDLAIMERAAKLIEESGHHMLYEYAAASSTEAAVVTKRILHKAAVHALGITTSLNTANMSSWIRTSILEGNIKSNAGALQPEESIQLMREGLAGDKATGIAEPVTVTAIITAIAVAASAAAGLVQALKNRSQLLTNNAQGFGNPAFGPERTDFMLGGQPAGGNNMLLPLLLAGGGFLMLNSK